LRAAVLSDLDKSLIEGVCAGDRRALAKAITLLESTRPDHKERAHAVLAALLPHTGKSLRVGISGVPGVGKSTFIEAVGLALIATGHKVAVLAVDPSSTVTGGSILGDKTRMERLSANDAAYIRPTPSSGTLGGVAERTREAILLCEAARFDVVIVETVGVGQSETTVAGMTDLFVLLQLPNAGDDLQAMKKGVMELADVVLVNKCDLDAAAAARAESQVTNALRVLRASGNPAHANGAGAPRVLQISALAGTGVAEFWQHAQEFQAAQRANGRFDGRRREQALTWMWDLVQASLLGEFRRHPAVQAALPDTLSAVSESRLAPTTAARTLLELFAS
jgi:LAO/AO transport system kinase